MNDRNDAANELRYNRLTPEEKERVLKEVYEIQVTSEEFNQLKSELRQQLKRDSVKRVFDRR